MDQTINFISNTADYRAVKKMKVNADIKPINILEFLISVEVTTNLQINRLLEKIVDITSFSLEIEKLFSKDIPSFLKEINSASFIKIIEQSIQSEYKNNIKDVLEVLKSYAFNKYLIYNKLMVDDVVGYYKILFPARKKQLKKVILK